MNQLQSYTIAMDVIVRHLNAINTQSLIDRTRSKPYRLQSYSPILHSKIAHNIYKLNSDLLLLNLIETIRRQKAR